MTLSELEQSLSDALPPPVDPLVQALWLDAKGNWAGAHELVQSREDDSAAWIHAYLHRREGDDGNARYWYRQAGKPFPKISLAEEWRALATWFLTT